jgi:glucokinase
MIEPGLVLGFDLGGTNLRAAVANTSGKLLVQHAIPTDAEHGAEKAICRVLQLGQELVKKSSGELRSVGVATMGITLDDRVEMAPNVPGWEKLKLPALVAEHFPGARFRVDNDVKAAGLAEVYWGALRGIDNGIYLNLGTGLACAVVVRGEVLQGAHGAAGEIGSNLRAPDEVHGAGSGRAPLEEFIGGRAIDEAATERFGQGAAARGAFARSAEGDAEARRFVDERLRELAFHVCNLCIALDPARVAVGGGMIAAEAVILPYLRSRLDSFVPYPPKLVPAALPDPGLRGAVALALAVQRIGA